MPNWNVPLCSGDEGFEPLVGRHRDGALARSGGAVERQAGAHDDKADLHEAYSSLGRSHTDNGAGDDKQSHASRHRPAQSDA